MFNNENIQALIEELKAHKERFNMIRFVQYGQPRNGVNWTDMPHIDVNIHDCNTVCCIGGWIQILIKKQHNAKHGLTGVFLSKYRFSSELYSHQFLIDDTLTLSAHEIHIRRFFINHLFIPRASNRIALYGFQQNCPWCQAYKLGLLKTLKMEANDNLQEIPDFYSATADHAIVVLEGIVDGKLRPTTIAEGL